MLFEEHVDHRGQLRTRRTGVRLSQAEMAALMGVPIRTYEDLERGRTAIRPIHINAACMALIDYAANNGGGIDLPADLLDIVRRAAR